MLLPESLQATVDPVFSIRLSCRMVALLWAILISLYYPPLLEPILMARQESYMWKSIEKIWNWPLKHLEQKQLCLQYIFLVCCSEKDCSYLICQNDEATSLPCWSFSNVLAIAHSRSQVAVGSNSLRIVKGFAAVTSSNITKLKVCDRSNSTTITCIKGD